MDWTAPEGGEEGSEMGSGEVFGGRRRAGRVAGTCITAGNYLKAERGGELAMPVLTNREQKLSHSQAYYSWAPASRSRAAISA